MGKILGARFLWSTVMKVVNVVMLRMISPAPGTHVTCKVPCWVSVGMPNGPNTEWFLGRNAERAECRTPAGRMPKRN